MTKDKTVTMSRELDAQLKDIADRIEHNYPNTAKELRAILAAPIVEADGMGEVIGYVDQWELDRIDKKQAHWATLWNSDGSTNPSRGGPSVALFASQPAPVAVALPERKQDFDDFTFDGCRDAGWNACLDKVKEMNR